MGEPLILGEHFSTSGAGFSWGKNPGQSPDKYPEENSDKKPRCIFSEVHELSSCRVVEFFGHFWGLEFLSSRVSQPEFF